jgi:serine/threonine-protein kinase
MLSDSGFSDAMAAIKPGRVIEGRWHKRRYHVTACLGAGSNGWVWQVTYGGQIMALKMAPPSSPIWLEADKRKTLGKTWGDCLGSYVYDMDDWFWQERVFPFFVMNYVQGSSLRDYLSHGRKTQAPALLVDALRKLEVFHQCGYAFGDLNPNNLLIHGNGDVSFIDYGGVTAFNRALKEYTPRYDRATWTGRPRLAEAGHDCFAMVMVFLDCTIPKVKTLLPNRANLVLLYAIINGDPVWRPYRKVLKTVLQGNESSVRELVRQLEAVRGQADPERQGSRALDVWLYCAFISSVMLFLGLLGTLVNH